MKLTITYSYDVNLPYPCVAVGKMDRYGEFTASAKTFEEAKSGLISNAREIFERIVPPKPEIVEIEG